VVDVNTSNPGVDFIPMGENPTGVVVTPDGKYTFASSADPDKPALYGFSNTRLLGDSTRFAAGLPRGAVVPSPLHLPDVLSCALAQPPQAIAIVARAATAGALGLAGGVPDGGVPDGGVPDGGVPDGGAPDGGVPDGGAPDGDAPAAAAVDGGPQNPYVIVATLRALGAAPARVVVLDPDSMAPGSLPACATLGSTDLAQAVSASSGAGPSWPDGVPYADAGTLASPEAGPPSVTACAAGAEDADAPVADAGPLPGTPAPAGQPASMVMRSDAPVLYVADRALPVIHVIDLHDPTSPHELQPLVASSLTNPARRVSVGGIAISPPTRDYTTYLYAIDARQGSIMVFDVTDPVLSPHVPLTRPHPELTPLNEPDRIGFSAPVVAVAFAVHDWPLPSQTDMLHQYTGLLCNPNPNAHPDSKTFKDLGAYYRADQVTLIEMTYTQGQTVQTLPSRLRGVFALATLSNGNAVVVDVDDWDAPCRRPDPMSKDPVIVAGALPDGGPLTSPAGLTGVLDLPEPPPSDATNQLDPYHAPLTYSAADPTLAQNAAVTLEAFFPVSAPNRVRSANLLRNDPIAGQHSPYVVGVPQLFNANGASVATSGASGTGNPLMLPTPLADGFIDPTLVVNPTEPNPRNRQFSSPTNVSPPSAPPGVRVSFDDPTAHLDQDWTVTYEGALPTVQGIAVDINSDDGFSTLTLSAPGAHFCAAGIEDWRIGRARAESVLAEQAAVLPASAPPAADPLPQWTADYVEIADDLLDPSDSYWGLADNDCWDGPLADNAKPGVAAARHDVCSQTFGSAVDADKHLLRDLPILRADDESLQVSRFAWRTDSSGGSADGGPATSSAERTTNRLVQPPDASNASWLRPVRCCFHHQATFKVRAGGEWVAVGSAVGLLHHVTSGPSGCALSCDPQKVLLNARTFDIPWSTDGACNAPNPFPFVDRNSPLAIRNPMFSFVMWSGCNPTAAGDAGAVGPFPPGDHTLSARDLAYRFSVRGGFSTLTVPLLTQGSGSAVSPQSMRYIGPFGQMAVVDGEAQGLIVIDLNLVAVVHDYL
jgi:hypothetical protein